MTAPDPVLEATRAIVERVAGPSRVPPESSPETPLSEAGFWLDSTGMLEVIVACEGEFGIVFDATRDLTAGALETLGSLTELIRAKHPRLRAAP